MSTGELNGDQTGFNRKPTILCDKKGKNEYSFNDAKIKEYTIKGAQGKNYEVELFTRDQKSSISITNQQDVIFHYLYNLSLNHTCFVDRIKPKKLQPIKVSLNTPNPTPNQNSLLNKKKSILKESSIGKLKGAASARMLVDEEKKIGAEPEQEEESNFDDIIYKGENPDEVILVDAARHMGFIYESGDETMANLILLRENGGKNISQRVEVLYSFEFSSTRGMMSTLVKIDNKYIIYSKGGDLKIKRLLAANQPFGEKTIEIANQLSEKGLRVLLLAMKVIHEDEWIEWFSYFDNKRKGLSDEKEINDLKVEQYEVLERGLTLIGCTAVEDKLQDNVPETIRELQTARINVWVLTGDNLPTAKNIG